MRTSLGAVAIAALVVGCGGGESSIAALSPSGQTTLTPGALPTLAVPAGPPDAASTPADADVPTPAAEVAATPPAPATPPEVPPARTIRFPWCPSAHAAASYALDEVEDQHRIILTAGVVPGGRYPVVIGFHGQPKRGTPPRDYWFPGFVAERVTALVARGAIRPVGLVLPLVRVEGGN